MEEYHRYNVERKKLYTKDYILYAAMMKFKNESMVIEV